VPAFCSPRAAWVTPPSCQRQTLAVVKQANLMWSPRISASRKVRSGIPLVFLYEIYKVSLDGKKTAVMSLGDPDGNTYECTFCSSSLTIFNRMARWRTAAFLAKNQPARKTEFVTASKLTAPEISISLARVGFGFGTQKASTWAPFSCPNSPLISLGAAKITYAVHHRNYFGL
jgi:hypothetical protein